MESDYNGEERRKMPQIVETRMSRADMDELVERLTEAQAASIASGIKAAVTDEVALKFWMSGIRALQEHAAEHTGRWLLGGVWAVVQKLMLFMLLGGVVYAIGGWSALAKVWHVIFGGSNP